jgi:hypothetical protein
LNVDTNSKAALQYLIEEASAFTPLVECDGEVYVRDRAGHLSIPPPEPKGETLALSSLSGLRDFIGANIDALEMAEHILWISRPDAVHLLGPREGRHASRRMIVTASADIPRFPFGRFHPAEEFNIALQSMFEHRDEPDGVEPADDRRELLKAAGKVKSGTKVIQEDDGIRQSVTVTTGIDLVAEWELPNPVRLTPWRTFPEVRQVTSTFILRARGDQGASFALFEADGGYWRRDARTEVHRHLSELLASLEEKGLALPQLVV